MSIPSQYANNSPAIDSGNLSSLQLAAKYYIAEGSETPFFINHQWLEAFKTFSSSGVVTPADLNVSQEYLSIVVKEGYKVFGIRLAQNCGPNENPRYELVYLGTSSELTPRSWVFGNVVIRGGSVSTGGGGPWGTGGLYSQDPTPTNSVDRQPDIVSNLDVTYGANISTATDGVA